ncbi:conjugal transfer protein TraF [uncultured Thiodictyon sp.]|uniref:conjugal transfer protein TraF n=1 Tax=uncultured Thiodictyon sp. TaxID=1846217 RepID=UPI0025E86B3F|nr:conjugal transfer protein TraF [uncultured Thiodictyon sp.]
MWFFFRSDCPYCEAHAPLLQLLGVDVQLQGLRQRRRRCLRCRPQVQDLLDRRSP